MLYCDLRPGDVFYDRVVNYALMVISIVPDVTDYRISVTYILLFTTLGQARGGIRTVSYDRLEEIRDTVEIF